MGIFDLFFPKKCLGCKVEGGYLCSRCLNVARRGWQRGNALVLFRYQGVVKKAILTLKYKFVSDISERLAEICAVEIGRRRVKLDRPVLIPIPLYTRRKNWRGFNQAEKVGKRLAQKLGWQYEPRLLWRIIPTQPQVGLPREKRLRNISGKYAVNSEILKLYRGKTLVLFDDVVTTGTTLNEAEKALREYGIKRIQKLAIAG